MEKKKETEAPREKHGSAKETGLRCTTCGVSVGSAAIWVEFKCPECKKARIIRCEKCKRLENPYTCSNCGFQGP